MTSFVLKNVVQNLVREPTLPDIREFIVKKISFCRFKKKTSRLKFIFIWVGMLRNKIVEFGAQKSHTYFSGTNALMFDAACLVEESFFLYVFDNEDGTTIKVNANTHRSMITDFFVPGLHGIDVNDVWFHQDGEIYHTSHVDASVL